MRIAAIILCVLAVVLGVAAFSSMSFNDTDSSARAAGRMIGTLLFPALFAIVSVVLGKKSGKSEEMT